jgi:hypothetical protein
MGRAHAFINASVQVASCNVLPASLHMAFNLVSGPHRGWDMSKSDIHLKVDASIRCPDCGRLWAICAAAKLSLVENKRF